MITCSLTCHLLGFLSFLSHYPFSLTCSSLDHIPLKLPELKALSQDLLLGVTDSDSGLTYLYPFYLLCLLWARGTMVDIYTYVDKLAVCFKYFSP